VSPELGQAAKRLVTGEDGDEQSSKQLAEHAANAFRKLGDHLARLLGKMGMEMLLERSVALASAEYSWLVIASQGHAVVEGRVASALQGAMEAREPETIVEAFAAVLSALVGLLERLIGEGLVERLLEEVWPDVFVRVAKETP
jgi:hypothetical protein